MAADKGKGSFRRHQSIQHHPRQIISNFQECPKILSNSKSWTKSRWLLTKEKFYSASRASLAVNSRKREETASITPPTTIYQRTHLMFPSGPDQWSVISEQNRNSSKYLPPIMFSNSFMYTNNLNQNIMFLNTRAPSKYSAKIWIFHINIAIDIPTRRWTSSMIIITYFLWKQFRMCRNVSESFLFFGTSYRLNAPSFTYLR